MATSKNPGAQKAARQLTLPHRPQLAPGFAPPEPVSPERAEQIDFILWSAGLRDGGYWKSLTEAEQKEFLSSSECEERNQLHGELMNLSTDALALRADRAKEDLEESRSRMFSAIDESVLWRLAREDKWTFDEALAALVRVNPRSDLLDWCRPRAPRDPDATRVVSTAELLRRAVFNGLLPSPIDRDALIKWSADHGLELPSEIRSFAAAKPPASLQSEVEALRREKAQLDERVESLSRQLQRSKKVDIDKMSSVIAVLARKNRGGASQLSTRVNVAELVGSLNSHGLEITAPTLADYIRQGEENLNLPDDERMRANRPRQPSDDSKAP